MFKAPDKGALLKLRKPNCQKWLQILAENVSYIKSTRELLIDWQLKLFWDKNQSSLAIFVTNSKGIDSFRLSHLVSWLGCAKYNMGFLYLSRSKPRPHFDQKYFFFKSFLSHLFCKLQNISTAMYNALTTFHPGTIRPNNNFSPGREWEA
jgi:hypothetical protein